MKIRNNLLKVSPFLGRLSQGVQYKSSRPGPHRLILIAVHGNEICGVEAYLKLENCIFDLLKDGSLEVRLANPLAFLLQQRSVNQDLNRSFINNARYTYESKRCQLIEESICRADLILDLHSTSAPGPAFVLPSQFGYNLSLQLPLELIILDLAKRCNGTTMSVADLYQIPAAVVECGQHSDLSSIDVAEECIKQFITHISLTSTCQTVNHQKILNCPKAVVADEGFEFVKPVHFMQKFAENDLVARSNLGEIRCPYESAYLIMPNANPVAGEEAFYWGIE